MSFKNQTPFKIYLHLHRKHEENYYTKYYYILEVQFIVISPYQNS